MIRRPKYSVREERTGYTVLMWLLIKKFTDRDVGSYKCVSTNSLGKADGTLRLYGKLHEWMCAFNFYALWDLQIHIGIHFQRLKLASTEWDLVGRITYLLSVVSTYIQRAEFFFTAHKHVFNPIVAVAIRFNARFPNSAIGFAIGRSILRLPPFFSQ